MAAYIMIGWSYSDPVRMGLATGVTRGLQTILEGAKTIVGTSIRFRVVTDVVYDDFMQWERPLGVERPLAPCGDSWRLPEQPSS